MFRTCFSITIIADILFLLGASDIHAQVNVSFSHNVSEGCPPLEVQFTSEIESCSDADYSWHFGSIGAESNEVNPTWNFLFPGTYTVRLDVTCSEGTASHEVQIVVFEPPIAHFYEDPITQVCAPVTLSLDDASTEGSAPITEWNWYWGDATTAGSGANVNHEYTFAGIFSVHLEVIDDNGCESHDTISNLVTVSDGPDIAFTASPMSYCEAPLEVNFNSNITPDFGLAYSVNWDFGDGSPISNSENPQHTYTSIGTYDVSLTATDAFNCSNTLLKEDFIRLDQIVPQYDVLEGDVVCVNSLTHFSNLTAYDCLWDFGDGSAVSTDSAAVHMYHESGWVTVSFTVDPNGECPNTINFQLLVEEVNPSFTTYPSPDPNNEVFSCSPPFTVDFINTSGSNATSFNYAFGDYTNSTNENPQHTYVESGTYHPKLTVHTENGCSQLFNGPDIIIDFTDPSYNASTTGACVGDTIVFTYDGSNLESDIANWNWNFGDGSNSNSAPPVNHTYTEQGDYLTSLTITKSNGCSATSYLEIHIGTQIEPDFEFVQYNDITGNWEELPADENVFCTEGILFVHNHLWDNQDIDNVNWNIGSSSYSSNQEYVTWHYQVDTIGDTDVTVISINNGCRDTIVLPDRFFLEGPIIDSIVLDKNCENPLTWTIDLYMYEHDYFDISFNDGSSPITGSTASSIVHDFPSPGTYTIQVVAYNTETGCEYNETITANVVQPVAAFFAENDYTCVSNPLVLNGADSEYALLFQWDFGDGTQSDWSDYHYTEHNYASSGEFDVTLSIKDIYGCIDQKTHPVNIIGPSIEIITNPGTHGCNQLDVEFSFAVNITEGYEVYQYIWTINDTTYCTETVNKSFGPGSFDVSLLINTYNPEIGDYCYNTLEYENYITVSSIGTNVQTLNNVTAACVGDVIQFMAGSVNTNHEHTWDFNDGSPVSNQIDPLHEFSNSGNYEVVLTVSDGVSCTDQDTIHIEIQEVDVQMEVNPISFTCPPGEPIFLNNTMQLFPTDFEWEITDMETNFTNMFPLEVLESYVFDYPGNFKVKLTATTSGGCTDSDSTIVTVNGPILDWSIDPDSICLGEAVTFTVSNLHNVDEFNWDIYGTIYQNIESFSYVFQELPSEGFYLVQIAFVDYQGDEQCIETYEIPIYVFDVAAGMEIYDSTTNLLSATGCSPFYAKLQNASTDENEIWWYYNDEENYQGGANTLYHAFTNTGQSDSVYTVRLVAKNAFECYDTTEQEITVFPNPQLQISNNATICLGDTLELFAMGANYYTWSPSDSINNIHAANPQVAPVSDTWYSVLGENFWGCIDNDSVLIQILDIPEIGITPQSDTIRIGESVNIEVFSDQENLILTWVPQYNISCYNCLYPELSPHEDTRYTLTVQDSMGCFEQHFYVDIFVIVEYTLDVPSAFTPLGHETNRIVYARGFGIKNLIEFRIYNRWGEEVFYTDDLEQGWDGYYNGKLQNIDTYKYFVKAEMWDGTIKTIKGDILLMR